MLKKPTYIINRLRYLEKEIYLKLLYFINDKSELTVYSQR